MSMNGRRRTCGFTAAPKALSRRVYRRPAVIGPETEGAPRRLLRREHPRRPPLRRGQFHGAEKLHPLRSGAGAPTITMWAIPSSAGTRTSAQEPSAPTSEAIRPPSSSTAQQSMRPACASSALSSATRGRGLQQRPLPGAILGPGAQVYPLSRGARHRPPRAYLQSPRQHRSPAADPVAPFLSFSFMFFLFFRKRKKEPKKRKPYRGGICAQASGRAAPRQFARR